jgi:hypothetical protein
LLGRVAWAGYEKIGNRRVLCNGVETAVRLRRGCLDSISKVVTRPYGDRWRIVVQQRLSRAAIAAVFVALFCFLVVRTAVVVHRATRDNFGAQLWPSHPEVLVNRAMGEIGTLAARGQAPSPAILRKVDEVARKAPLAPEPFLIRGAMARVQGRDDLAERLLAAALARDPRSEAVRYLLADLYLHTGRPSRALLEMGVFARLMPAAAAQVVPAIAAFAKAPGAVPRLRGFFRRFPELEPLVLLELSKDARNVDLVLALASGADSSPKDAVSGWFETLVYQLVAEGNFAKAYETWRAVAGVRRGARGLFNPTFEKISPPPPFNWRFASSGGVAEPLGDGRLRVTFYGSENTALADQLLLLPPGRYQLNMDVSGQFGEESAVAWLLVCLPSGNSILNLPVDQAASNVKGTFSVEAGCTAQRLELIGSASEFPKPIEFSISRLKLTRAASQ